MLSAGFNNNGICKFIKNGGKRSRLYAKNAISIDMFGKAFFHGYEFYSVSHGRVNILTPKFSMNEYHMKFIITAINLSVKGKFSYNQMCSSKRVKRLVVQLPVNEDGDIDYDFMESYMRQEERRLVNEYTSTLSVNSLMPPPPREILREKPLEWRIFYIGEIFEILPGKRLRKEDMTGGYVPFVGASDTNNGVTAFIREGNASIDRNVLGVNYNGSVAESFYHPYRAVFSDDVKRLHVKGHEGNKYIYLFMKTVIKKQKRKYNYGYKFSDSRMRRQIILLPVDEKGSPDFEFMTDYMMMLEGKLLRRYFEAKKTGSFESRHCW